MQHQERLADEQNQTTEQATSVRQAAGNRLRAYERPEVVDYGSVRELTRGTGSKPTFDMMTGTRRLT